MAAIQKYSKLWLPSSSSIFRVRLYHFSFPSQPLLPLHYDVLPLDYFLIRLLYYLVLLCLVHLDLVVLHHLTPLVLLLSLACHFYDG